ncbi:MAG: efflux RND transporter permease subunit [Bacteroidales bacterium]
MSKEIIKEFKPTSWSIDNKVSIYVLVVIISIFGIINYNSIPKEQFPEIVIPNILVNTVYPGTSPEDIENLITRPIEKQLKSVKDVKKITSNNIQDFSMIVVEFNAGVDQAEAKQRVKDAVDKAKSNLPSDLKTDPVVMEIDLSQIPIMYINISGDYSLEKLKTYAEKLQDEIESFPEISRVDIVGTPDREIQINLDMYKMHAVQATISNVEQAIASENMIISAGNIDINGLSYSLRVNGEFKNIDEIRNIYFKTSGGGVVKLSDVAEVVDTSKKLESFARFNGKNVVTLNVIKKSGQNLLDASDKIKTLLADFKKNKVKDNISIDISGDQSKFTRSILNELNNTIIIGFILVVVILMFFMGVTNAFFVSIAAPLSMAIAYIVLPQIDFTMNMLVMFSFIFALGIIVDDAIVVIENTYRIFQKHKGEWNIVKSAKVAAGEVFVPILSGTLTTLAPFFPLAFWPGVVGKFMLYIPVMLIITLFSSLIVAYIFNPVFAVQFMKIQDDSKYHKTEKKKWLLSFIIMLTMSGLFHLIGLTSLGNLFIIFSALYGFHVLVGRKMIWNFQHRFYPNLLSKYEKLIKWSLKGKNPYRLFWGLIILFFVTFFLVGIVKPKVAFFPDNEPNTINIYVELPIGTNVEKTDSITRIIERQVNSVIKEYEPIIESVIVNVAKGASDNIFDNSSVKSNKSKISINFVEFSKRHGISTMKCLDKLRENIKGIDGASINIEKNRIGPPTGKPVNIEVKSDNIVELQKTSQQLLHFIDSLKIPGLTELKTDFEMGKPEAIISIDKEKANRQGISTAQIGMEIRNALLGKEASKFRDFEEQYPIQLRYSEDVRHNINKLLDAKIIFRDMNSGQLKQIPISSVASVQYINNVGAIKRLQLKRVITLTGNVVSGYTANEVVAKIKKSLQQFNKPESVNIQLTGEQEDQKETMAFLSKAMLLTILLILFILITQFNSFSKAFIILSEVLFSINGVLIGYMLTGMTISIVMTGLGIVALGGIVVRNGILLIEFTDILKSQGYKTRNAIIQAGKIRITPVLLTASTTIIGLIPLAIGFSINFQTLLSSFNPQIHFGGDNVMFFGPLSWTIVFGLFFATFLTLIMVPVMYFIAYELKLKAKRKLVKRKF